MEGKVYTSQTAANLYVASGGAEDWYDLLSKSVLNITVRLDLKIIRCRCRLTYRNASLTSKFVGISISETPRVIDIGTCELHTNVICHYMSDKRGSGLGESLFYILLGSIHVMYKCVFTSS